MQDEVLYKQLGRKLFIKLNPDEDDLNVVITDCCKIDEFIYIKGFIDKEDSKSFIRTNRPYLISENNKKYYVIEYDELQDLEKCNSDKSHIDVLLTLTQNQYSHA